jgi:hypothetical protein
LTVSISPATSGRTITDSSARSVPTVSNWLGSGCACTRTLSTCIGGMPPPGPPGPPGPPAGLLQAPRASASDAAREETLRDRRNGSGHQVGDAKLLELPV